MSAQSEGKGGFHYQEPAVAPVAAADVYGFYTSICWIEHIKYYKESNSHFKYTNETQVSNHKWMHTTINSLIPETLFINS